MNILMFGWEYPPFNSGGLGVACRALARALVNEGATLTFVLPKKLPLSEERFSILFADIEDSPLLKSPYTSLQKLGIKGENFLSQVFSYGLAAGSIAAREHFDIIHAHDWLGGRAGLKAREVSGKPLVIHVHATEFDRTGGLSINERVYAIEKEVMEKADAVVAVSNFTKEKITRHYGIAPEKITVIHNAIDKEGWDRSFNAHQILQLKQSGKRVVLFVGRITLQKGPDYFLQAAKRVSEIVNDVVFVIAGSGDMERQLVEQAAWLGIGDKVIFTGFLRGDELFQLYRSADLFVMPSVSEPFGISALESLQHGTPVLISKQSGVAEVLSHALKVDFWDVDEMTNKIVGVLSHPSLRQCLQENGCKEVQKFSWSEAAKKCLSLYTQLLNPVHV